MALDSGLVEEIVSLLIPHMEDERTRRSHILRAFGTNSNIESKLQFDGAAGIFARNLVAKLHILHDTNDQNALMTFLVSFRNDPSLLSKTDQTLVDKFIEQIRAQATSSSPNLSPPKEQPDPSSESPIKHANQDIPQGIAVIIAVVITGICALVAAVIMQLPRLQETPTLVPASATVTPSKPTMTADASPTELPTATATSTFTLVPATVVVTSNPTPVTASPTLTDLPIPTAAALSYVIFRSPDTIAVCPASAGDYGRLELYIGRNEVYTLGVTFPESAFTAANQCFCFQQASPQFPGPAVCDLINTALYPRVSDWRNQPVTLRIDGRNVGSCPEESGQTLYSCQIR
ncbi:MAG: hypothetical protein IAE83_09490 [Anaerolinea sp.]|nr:hypothetical protein [Anaerolinea sp.]